jgi:hypothetical protein
MGILYYVWLEDMEMHFIDPEMMRSGKMSEETHVLLDRVHAGMRLEPQKAIRLRRQWHGMNR